MMKNYQGSLAQVLKHEGGWADHPKDPGGATMKGITIGTFRDWRGRDVTKQELRNITDAEVELIYKRNYWDKVKGDSLPSGVDHSVFDPAVNSGPSRGIKFLQKAVGVKADGVIGPQTLKHVNAAEAIPTIKAIAQARSGFLRGLKTWQTFGKGWSRRVAEVEVYSMKISGTSFDPRTEAKESSAKVQKDVSAGTAVGGGSAGGAAVSPETFSSMPQWAIWLLVAVVVLIVINQFGRALHERARAKAFTEV